MQGVPLRAEPSTIALPEETELVEVRTLKESDAERQLVAWMKERRNFILTFPPRRQMHFRIFPEQQRMRHLL